MATLTPALVFLAAALQIEASPEVTCPSSDGLKTALAGLLPSAEGEGGAPGKARLSRDGQSLLVQVVDSRGRLLSERWLEPVDTPVERCPERTAEVAVIVAAAMATLRGPGTAGPPDDAPATPKSEAANLSAALEPSRRRTPRAEIALHLGASLAGGTAAPGFAAGIAYLAKPWLTVGVGALYTGEHVQGVDSGQAVWSRWAGVAGLTGRASLAGWFWVDGGVSAAAGVRMIEGRSFPTVLRASTLDPGLLLNLRFGAVGERTGFWTGATLGWWARSQGVFVQGSDEKADLPKLELMFGLGMTFGLGVIPSGDPT